MFKKDLRVGLFVDAANIHISTSTTFNYRRVNYEKLLDFAISDYKDPSIKYRLYRALVYAVRHGDDSDESKRAMEKWEAALGYIGYDVKTKDVTHYVDGRSKADWDVTLTIDVVRMIDLMDKVVIASGDGDFLPLVRWCQEKGRIVRVIGVEGNTSRKLKEQADIFTPITERHLMAARPKPEASPKTPPPTTSEGPTPEERVALDKEIEEFEAKKST